MSPNTTTHATTTPWRNATELHAVRTSLYTPSTPADRASAISLVSAWKTRGNLPHAVESTAHLFSALQFHEAQGLATTSICTSVPAPAPSKAAQAPPSATPTAPPAASPAATYAIRATYTLALSRFVTGLADLGRRRENAYSMYEVARSIGLPAHFVELRHESAHEEMPGLGRLARAAEEALGWLWGVYWAQLPAVEEGSGSGSGSGLDKVFGKRVGTMNLHEPGDEGQREKFRETVRGELKAFRKERKSQMAARKTKTKKSETYVNKFARSFLKLMWHERDWEDVCTVLVDEGMIIPGPRNSFPLDTLPPDWTRDDDLPCNVAAPMSGAYMLWDHLLLSIAGDERFLPVLYKHLIKQLTAVSNIDPEVDTRKVGLYNWLRRLIASEPWQGACKQEKDRELQAMLFRECSLNPGHWTSKLGECLLSWGNDDVIKDWEGVFRASLPAGAEMDPGGQDPYDFENTTDEEGLAEVVLEPAEVEMQDAGTGTGGWRRDTETWRPVPIGVVLS